MIAILVRAVTKNGWLGLAGSLLFCASKPFLYFQVFAMSEPLFFFCTLMAFYLLWLGFQTIHGSVVVMWGFCGAAFLTRYVGVVSLAVTVEFCSFFPRTRSANESDRMGSTRFGSFDDELADSESDCLRNVTNREAYFHPLSGEEIHAGIMIFGDGYIGAIPECHACFMDAIGNYFDQG